MYNITRENISANTLRFLYSRYKDFIVPFFVIAAVFMLFVKVVVPQIQDLFNQYKEQEETKQTLSNMQNNLNLLRSINDSTQDLQLAIVSSALPIDKDFSSVLYAISSASSLAGVSLGNFSFSVGSLSKIEDNSKFPSFSLNLTLNGSVYKVNNFIGEIKRTLPLSEVTGVFVAENSSTIEIDFYYKPLKRLKYDDSLPISIVSAEGLSLINELSTFNIPEGSSSDLAPSSIPSSNPFF